MTFGAPHQGFSEYGKQQELLRQQAEAEAIAAQELVRQQKVTALHAKYSTAISAYPPITIETPAVYWPLATSGNPPASVLPWANTVDAAKSPRSVWIEQTLASLASADKAQKIKLLQRLDVLLGAPTVMAQATASQDFLNPWLELNRQFYWVILNFIQHAYRQKIALELSEEAAWQDLNATNQQNKPLYTLLKAVADNYCVVFPYIKYYVDTFFEQAFADDAILQTYLANLLDQVHNQLPKDDKLLPNTHTQDAFEQRAIFIHTQAYKARVEKYLTQYPEDIPLLCEVAELEIDTTLHSTQEARIKDLSTQMAYLPSRIPLTCSDHFLKMDLSEHPEAIDAFLQRGAQLTQASNAIGQSNPHIWALLRTALNNYRPKDALDTLFCRELYAYCANSSKRNVRHWSLIAQSIRDANLASRSLVSCLHPKMLEEESWRHYFSTTFLNSSLFALTQEAAERPTAQQPSPIILATPYWLESITTTHPSPDANTTAILPESPADWHQSFAAIPRTVTTLDMSQCKLWSNPNSMFSLISSLPYYFDRFKALSFAHTELNDLSLERLMTATGYINMPCATIESVDLSNNFITDKSLEIIANNLHRWLALKTLNLSGNLITEHGVKKLQTALCNCSITHIHFGDNPAISQSLKEAIAAQLELNAAQPIQPIPTTIAQAEADANALIEHFTVKETAEEQAKKYIEKLPHFDATLVQLDLSDHTLNGAEINTGHLFIYLSSCDNALEEINFSGQPLKKMPDKDFETLISLFKRFPLLKKINFNNTGIAALNTQSTIEQSSRNTVMPKLVSLKQHLQYCPSLKTLELNGNELIGKDIDVLISLAKTHKSLTEISVDEDTYIANKVSKLFMQLKENNHHQQTLARQTEDRSNSNAIVPYQHQSALQQSQNELLTPPSLMTMKLRVQPYTLISHDMDWHHLIQCKGDRLIFNFSAAARQCAKAQRRYFERHGSFEIRSYGDMSEESPQEIYRRAFRQALSNGLKSKEVATQEDLTTNPGILGQMTQTLSAPIEFISASLNTLVQAGAARVDEQERQTYFQNIAEFISIFPNETDRVEFIEDLQSLFSHRYEYDCHTDNLTRDQAISDVTHILNWIGYCHSKTNKLIVWNDDKKIYQLNCLNTLMTMVFGKENTDLIIAVPTSHMDNYIRFIETPYIYAISENQVRPKFDLTLLDIPVLSSPAEMYEDAQLLDPRFKQLEKFFRQTCLAAVKEYRDDFIHSWGYYEKIFMPFITGHGGKISSEQAKELYDLITKKSFEEFLAGLNKFTQDNLNKSGLRDEFSLLTRYIETVLKPVHEKEKLISQQASAQSYSSIIFFRNPKRNQWQENRTQFIAISTILEGKIKAAHTPSNNITI